LGVGLSGDVSFGATIPVERFAEAPDPHQLAELVDGIVGEGSVDHGLSVPQ
jgi:hypothetical protein